MKKSDIRQIIKEEVINLIKEQYITEAFGDPLIAKVNKLGRLDRDNWMNFWTATANTYDIAWDKLPKGTLQKIQPTDKQALDKGKLSFWVITTNKPNPFQTGWESSQLYPGVHAVTLGGKVQYYGKRSDKSKQRIGAKDSGDTAYDAAGKGFRGTLQVKKIKEITDEVYVMDLDSFRGGTTAMKAKRAELKSGKDTFTDNKAWKRANLDRYKTILADKIADPAGLGRKVGEILKIGHKWIEDALSLTKVNKYGEMVALVGDTEVKVETISNQTSNAIAYLAKVHVAHGAGQKLLQQYPEYAEGGKKAGSEDAWMDTKGFTSYEKKDLRDLTMKIKAIHNAFKASDGKALAKMW